MGIHIADQPVEGEGIGEARDVALRLLRDRLEEARDG
jgi:hypothetical protein